MFFGSNETQSVPSGHSKLPRRGQGITIYGGWRDNEVRNWVTTLSDSLRVGEQLGRVRLESSVFGDSCRTWCFNVVSVREEAMTNTLASGNAAAPAGKARAPVWLDGCVCDHSSTLTEEHDRQGLLAVLDDPAWPKAERMLLVLYSLSRIFALMNFTLTVMMMACSFFLNILMTLPPNAQV